VKGVVHFEGQAPERKPIDMKVAGGCHAEGTVLTEQVIVNDGKLQNVFVRVKSGLAGWSVPPASSTPVVMNQQGCVYTPHVLGVRVGQPIEIQNSDEATHNVNARPQRRKNEAFNQLQLAGSAALTRTFGEEEVAVRFECNLHPWMNAWVAVVDHPFFAVSGPDGSFAIEGLPPGDYELEAWHERFGRTTARVSVSAGAAAEVSFTFEPR
jgi:plastocyanin